MTIVIIKMIMMLVDVLCVTGELSQRMRIPGNVWVDMCVLQVS